MSCSFTLMNLEPNLRSRFTTNHSNTWLTTLATLKPSACHVGLQLFILDYAEQCVQAYCTALSHLMIVINGEFMIALPGNYSG